MPRTYMTTPEEIRSIPEKTIREAIALVRTFPEFYYLAKKDDTEALADPNFNATVTKRAGADAPTAHTKRNGSDGTGWNYSCEVGWEDRGHTWRTLVDSYDPQFHQDGYIAPGTVHEVESGYWVYYRVDKMWSNDYMPKPMGYETEAEARKAAYDHLYRHDQQAAAEYRAEHGLGDEE